MLTADRTRDDPSLSKASSAEPIYMYRPVLNAEEILTWAASQGFTSALEPDDMHVTVVFSRRPFSIDYSESARSHSAIGYSNIVVQDDARSVVPLGDKGAVVLKLTSDELQTEHAYFCEQGASWDYPEYQPHVTITYQGGDLPIARVEPFTGPIILGPLRAKPLNTGAGDDVKEVNLLKRQLDDDIFTLSYEAVSRSMALGLDGRIHAHQTADGQAVYMPGASQQEYLSLYARQAESPDMVSRREGLLTEAIAAIIAAVMTHSVVKSAEVLKLDTARRIAWGWASVSTLKGEMVVDRQGDIIAPDEMEKMADRFMASARTAKAMHEGDGIGEVLHSLPLTAELAKALGLESDREGWIIGMKIHDDAVWQKFVTKEFTGFSIGGSAKRRPAA